MNSQEAISYADLSKSITDSSRLDEIYSAVQEMKALTQHIPVLARQDPQGLMKARNVARGLGAEGANRGPRSVFFDPLSLQYALGYKDRRYSLTFDTLKRVVNQLGIVSAIINTRIAQIASFSEPYRLTKSLGFQIRHKSLDRMTTDAEKEFITKLEAFVLDCGEPGQSNPFTRLKRPKFEAFLKTIVRDTLTYDQLAFEVVPRRNMIPFEFWPVDAATIRIATPDRDAGMHHSYHHRNTICNLLQPHRFGNLYENQLYGEAHPTGNPVQHVQVVNGQIENVYTRDELAFGIRNPRSDIYIQGYGYGELEQLVTIVTSILYAEEYNRRFFMQGAHPKGMLNFKGDNWTPDQLEAFKRQWVAQVAGTENSWKTPITQSEGIEWIDMQRSNAEMEYRTWLEYLIKITCGVYLMDPAEINFDLHGGVQQTPLFESSQEWKLKASRDRGLKPLLRFIAGLVNDYVIDKIDDHFVFEFAGLDELTEQEKHEMAKEQLASYKTLNEVRREMDLPDVEGGIGDIPLNPTLVQLLGMQQQREDQRAQMEQQAKQQEAEAAAAQKQEQPPEDPEAETKRTAAEQDIRHKEDKHPFELEALAQRVGVPGPLSEHVQQPEMVTPEGGTPAEQSAGGQPEAAFTLKEAQAAPREEAKPERKESPPRGGGGHKRQYAGLFGKGMSFDDWLDKIRKARSCG